MMKVFAYTMIALMASSLPSVQAQEKAEAPKPKTVSKEDRESMAKIHEKMAECLRSDKSIQDCHSSMRKDCQGMGELGCPGMGEMMRHRWSRQMPGK